VRRGLQIRPANEPVLPFLLIANLTVTVEDKILRRGKVRALEQDTSVNSLLPDCLEAYAAAGSTWERATEAILLLSAESRSGRGDRRWTRDEFHERRTFFDSNTLVFLFEDKSPTCSRAADSRSW
jgi:hypothetical protein